MRFAISSRVNGGAEKYRRIFLIRNKHFYMEVKKIMAQQQVQRITLNGSGFEEIQFSYPSGKYLVKNFSDGDVYVSFAESGQTTDSSIRIASGFGQVCFINERGGEAGQLKTKSIFVSGSGEVEIQQLWY